jgi:predicted RNA-binding Zn-ribbon protein involved in translation (DUF1610 family)
MQIRFDCSHCGKKLKAPDDAEGKKVRCPDCGNVVVVPEEIIEAEEVAEPASPVNAEPGYAIEVSPNPAKDDGKERHPCPMCGEMILVSAAKCRFCGEIFDPKLRVRAKKKTEDGDMTSGDWPLAILCSGIGCICGIAYMIQGKSKGLKMFGVSLAMVVFWNIVFGAISALGEHAHK